MAWLSTQQLSTLQHHADHCRPVCLVGISAIAEFSLVCVWQGNHERDQPYTGDRFQNQATDSGGVPMWALLHPCNVLTALAAPQAVCTRPGFQQHKHGDVSACAQESVASLPT